MQQDIRWQQRFNNFRKALATLTEAVDLANTRPLSKLEQQGIIQAFEYTHELAWNVLKDFLEFKGISGLIGSKDATRIAFKNGLIENGDDWMRMIADRNLSSHTYDENTANAIADNILNRYYPAYRQMAERFTGLHDEEA